jgi:hypothetical protein
MKQSAAPSFIEPMMARLVERLPTGKWLYELKFDGYRALAFKTGQEVRLVSRNQVVFKYPQLANALKSLPAQNVIIDGEIAALDTICFGTLGGSATLDAKLGARSHERHSYHDLARSHGLWGSDLEFRCRISRTHSHLAWSGSSIPHEPPSGPSAFDQRGRRTRRQGLRLSLQKYRVWRGDTNSAPKKKLFAG